MFATEYVRTQYGFAAAPRIGSTIPIAAVGRSAFAKAEQVGAADLDLEIPGHVTSTQPESNFLFWRALQIID
jgi:hypothetical protein